MSKPSVSAVVPVYNSEQILPQLVERLCFVLGQCTSSFEVILVNDGSVDRGWDVICRLCHERPQLRALDLMRNYGQHNALLAGIRMAANDTIVTIDDDLQQPPEEIPKLLDKLAAGFDVVYGVPQLERHGLWRGLASKLTKLALKTALGAEIAPQVSAFRVFRAQVSNAFANFQGRFVSIDVLLAWGTTRFASIPVRHDKRLIGQSNYTFGKLATHALNMMTGFSTVPLQLASLIGFAFTLFGVGVLAYVMGHYLVWGGSVPGFPFLASIIAIFSGAQLFAIGIIGEYLARLHFRMMDWPTYTIRQSIGPGRASK